MRFWFINSWAYVCLVGLLLMVFALRGFKPQSSGVEIVARIIGGACGLAIIIAGIWMNARWLIH